VLIEQYQELNRAENQISEGVFDAISNITTVIILRVEKLVFSAIMAKVEQPYELFLRSSKISEVKWFLTNLCASSMRALVLGLYFWQNIGSASGVLVAEVYLLMNYLNNIGEQFFRFTGMYGDIVVRKTRVMNSEILTKDFRAENFTNHVLPTSWQRLEIRGLSFSYHSQEEGSLHLENIHISFARGERIALVGESGSGKTTLLKVMRDLYHPRNLNLQVDDRVIREGFEGISRAIALVPQNPEIFATTILENITLGAEYPIDFVEKFTDMACFSDVVRSLPRGLDSSIKEKGVNLSGGQQQRLALSRGLLACHDKDIVLLDEPTSSLDTSNEMRIYQNIFRGFQGKTIISSIHRLHLLPLFDTIYLFDRGRIVASGNLRQLLSVSTQFQQMWHNYTDQSKEAEVTPV
jgi:ABC-type multidrug transport system fused ATPase/permease subunit